MKKSWMLVIILVVITIVGMTIYLTTIPKNASINSTLSNNSNVSKVSTIPDFPRWSQDFRNDTCYQNTVNLSFSKCNYRGLVVYPLDYRHIGNGCADAYESPIYYENGTILCWLYGGFAAYSGRANCPNFDEEKNCETNFSVKIP
jgi:hypothetical protein